MKSHDNTTIITTTTTTNATTIANDTTTANDDINIKSPVLSKAYELMERLQKTDIYNSPINNNNYSNGDDDGQPLSFRNNGILSSSKEVEQKREDLLTKARMLIDSVNKNIIPSYTTTNTTTTTSSTKSNNNYDNTNTKSWQDILDKFNIGKANNNNSSSSTSRARARSHSPTGHRSKSPSFMGPTISYQNSLYKSRYNYTSNTDDNNSKQSRNTEKSILTTSTIKNRRGQYNDYDDDVTAEWKAWSNHNNGNINTNSNTVNSNHDRGRRPASTPSYLLPTRASLGSHSMLGMVSSSSSTTTLQNTNRRTRSTTPTNNRQSNINTTTSNIKPRPLNMDLAAESDNTNTKPLRSRSTTPTSVASRAPHPKMEKAQLELLFGHLIENKSTKGWSQQLRR
jgi:hypothetical protein